ncbi:DNA-directed RNA polymerase sigma-70 factor [Dyadobacter endophyticus]|uniref:DNA-directed RNA polymerase sigma-70 factor n=2 Tax=Spirosomataceae TaxID=2896860 RepID=A0ABQ1YPL6_9BACT|nr:DNA-directed RNA polymerase sigma-70 factor [Dyadobacter endophyticus]
MGICLRYSNSDQQAQEILNDSFLKVFENILITREILVFRAWLRRIVVNTALDHYRKERRRMERITTDYAEEDMTIAEDVIDKLSAEEIIKLLQELPESQRLVFNLYEIEGYNHQEIGEMLGFPAATSRTYLTRAKQRIKSLMLQRKFGSRYGE